MSVNLNKFFWEKRFLLHNSFGEQHDEEDVQQSYIIFQQNIYYI